MASAHRQPEVKPICDWYEQHGYRLVLQNDPPVHFEGMGDAIWHPLRRLLYIGYGFRTDLKALERAANLLHCPVVALKLIDPSFYHLDTALSVLDQQTAIYAPEAFDKDSQQILQRLFPRLTRAPLNEAKLGLLPTVIAQMVSISSFMRALQPPTKLSKQRVFRSSNATLQSS